MFQPDIFDDVLPDVCQRMKEVQYAVIEPKLS